ncbi:unnamed protein product, partial [Rotaria sordida]
MGRIKVATDLCRTFIDAIDRTSN